MNTAATTVPAAPTYHGEPSMTSHAIWVRSLPREERAAYTAHRAAAQCRADLDPEQVLVDTYRRELKR